MAYGDDDTGYGAVFVAVGTGFFDEILNLREPRIDGVKFFALFVAPVPFLAEFVQLILTRIEGFEFFGSGSLCSASMRPKERKAE